MDDAGSMNSLKRFNQSVSQVGQVSGVPRQSVGALSFDLGLQARAVHELGDHEAQPVIRLVPGLDIQDARDAGTAHPCQNASLSLQAPARYGVRSHLWVEDLHRHVQAVSVPGLPDHSHAARAQAPEQLVAAHLRAGSHTGQARGGGFLRTHGHAATVPGDPQTHVM